MVSDHDITRAANARFRPGGDSLVELLEAHGIRAHLRTHADTSYVEIMVFRPDVESAQAIILDHRRNRLAGLELLQRCPGCSYSLNGLSSPPRCPECGRDFNPDRNLLILADEYQLPESPEESPRATPQRHTARRMYLSLTIFFGVLTVLPCVIAFSQKNPLALGAIVLPGALALISAAFARHARNPPRPEPMD